MSIGRAVIGKNATVYIDGQEAGPMQEVKVRTACNEEEKRCDLTLQGEFHGRMTLSSLLFEPCKVCEARRKLYKHIDRQNTGDCYICKSTGRVRK